MAKRYVSIFTVIIFIITMLPLSFTQKAYAYSNNSYFNDLKVGFVSMSAANITISKSNFTSTCFAFECFLILLNIS